MTETSTSSGTAPIYFLYWGNILVKCFSASSPEEAQQKADELWRELTED